MGIKEELNARARFKEGDRVGWKGHAYTVWVRYWRRAEDAFYYDLREPGFRGVNPRMSRKIPEPELEVIG